MKCRKNYFIKLSLQVNHNPTLKWYLQKVHIGRQAPTPNLLNWWFHYILVTWVSFRHYGHLSLNYDRKYRCRWEEDEEWHFAARKLIGCPFCCWIFSLWSCLLNDHLSSLNITFNNLITILYPSYFLSILLWVIVFQNWPRGFAADICIFLLWQVLLEILLIPVMEKK